MNDAKVYEAVGRCQSIIAMARFRDQTELLVGTTRCHWDNMRASEEIKLSHKAVPRSFERSEVFVMVLLGVWGRGSGGGEGDAATLGGAIGIQRRIVVREGIKEASQMIASRSEQVMLCCKLYTVELYAKVW